MINYSSYILTNLSIFSGVVENPEVVKELNMILYQLHEAGYKKLVQNFRDQTDPDRARDFLFEIWICRMLMNNSKVVNLQYEPKEQSPPDFRFNIDSCCFDIQIKRLHNINNEIVRRLFERECKRRLSTIPKSWFIHFRISDSFEGKHMNLFFSDLKKDVEKLSPCTSLHEALKADKYPWKYEDKELIRFSLSEKNGGAPGITLGAVHGTDLAQGLVQRIDVDPIRESVERLLRKSKKSFSLLVSESRSNLVIVQADNQIWTLDNDTMADALYGNPQVTFAQKLDGTSVDWESRLNDGLFQSGNFQNICGLILVPQNVSFVSKGFEGLFFPNPSIAQLLEKHPKPFEEMKFCILNEWKRKRDENSIE